MACRVSLSFGRSLIHVGSSTILVLTRVGISDVGKLSFSGDGAVRYERATVVDVNAGGQRWTYTVTGTSPGTVTVNYLAQCVDGRATAVSAAIDIVHAGDEGGGAGDSGVPQPTMQPTASPTGTAPPTLTPTATPTPTPAAIPPGAGGVGGDRPTPTLMVMAAHAPTPTATRRPAPTPEPTPALIVATVASTRMPVTTPESTTAPTPAPTPTPLAEEDAADLEGPDVPIISDVIPRVRNALENLASSPRLRNTLIIILAVVGALVILVFAYLIWRRG